MPAQELEGASTRGSRASAHTAFPHAEHSHRSSLSVGGARYLWSSVVMAIGRSFVPTVCSVFIIVTTLLLTAFGLNRIVFEKNDLMISIIFLYLNTIFRGHSSAATTNATGDRLKISPRDMKINKYFIQRNCTFSAGAISHWIGIRYGPRLSSVERQRVSL